VKRQFHENAVVSDEELCSLHSMVSLSIYTYMPERLFCTTGGLVRQTNSIVESSKLSNLDLSPYLPTAKRSHSSVMLIVLNKSAEGE
jgi:hypothetical protein